MIHLLAHSWVDATEAPLYIWRMPPSPNDDELNDALQTIQKWIREIETPYGWVNDPSQLKIKAIATQRAALAEHLKVVEPYAIRYCAGMATVLSQSWVRGVSTAVGWMTPYKFPTKYVADVESTKAWVRGKLAERGVDVMKVAG